MFRIGRLTDYGIVVMAHLAERGGDGSHNARELAAETRLSVPVVSKILKALTRAGLLTSQRGSKGGYSLARSPGEISVVEMITALEGPVGITECTLHPGVCAQEPSCQVRDPWQRINGAVRAALDRITLADLAKPSERASAFVPLFGIDRVANDGRERDARRADARAASAEALE
ncbi:MAG TPA: SUF system Fe-S cluster assembly regulator [Myxococcota bacterium]|nr:SUF system Fe-S cluster assembly regulator [Myxococcota bacterium]